MDITLLFARILLFVVFAIAGFAKLIDLPGSRQAVRDFGIPSAMAISLGTLLPFAELAIGLTMIPVSTAWWGAIGALILLLLFIVAISVNLALGRKPDCYCFGALHSAPAGWSTLVRNGLLATLAGLIVWQGPERVGTSAVSWLASLTAGEILGLIAITIILGLFAVEGWFLFHLLRQNGRLLLRVEALEKILSGQNAQAAPTQAAPNAGLAVGMPAPAFQLPGINGEILTLDALRIIGKPLLLIFSDPNCGPCNALLPEIARWQHEHETKLTIALISGGVLEANRARSSEHGLKHVLLQRDREVAQAYRANGTPSAVIVRSDGTIGSVLVGGAEAIRDLVARTMGTPTPERLGMTHPTARGDCNCGNGNGHTSKQTRSVSLKIGDRAPTLSLPNLSGKTVALTEFLGEETLLLFWNPHCGFCNRMLNDLKMRETKPPKDAPRLLIVSTGSVEENQAMGLLSPIVLDQSFSVGHAFGASGTPSAVLVDAKGKIASEVAVGAAAVLTLANPVVTKNNRL